MQYNVDIVLFSQWNKNVINAKIKCGKKICGLLRGTHLSHKGY